MEVFVEGLLREADFGFCFRTRELGRELVASFRGFTGSGS